MGLLRLSGALLVPALLLGAGRERLPPPTKVEARLEAIAETHLLMEGLADPNFHGLERLLAEKPAEAQAWAFARGRALLLAETGNLLMLRPPKGTQAQPIWFQRAIDLRRQATELAQALAKKDFPGSRAALVEMANSCNRCHQAFRIPTEIVPFAPPKEPPAKTSGPGT